MISRWEIESTKTPNHKRGDPNFETRFKIPPVSPRTPLAHFARPTENRQSFGAPKTPYDDFRFSVFARVKGEPLNNPL